MMAETMLQQYLQTQDDGVVMTYKGALSQEILVGLSDALRSRLGFEGRAKKLFSVFIEITQNIKNYSVELERTLDGVEIGVGIVSVVSAGDVYVISSGNKMLAQHVDRMNNRCALIKAMNYEQLRQYHREKMREGPPEGSKGAGLGLIDIAMKANQDVEFRCLPLNEQHAFFSINAYIRKGY
jgi:hypothetical protein